ncbi:hypothetical protein HD554DRAFT_2036920 [Boletus coccyginus]|nr:hypothetical protein HD554DRAFT_2036920 [Boletus coccyginus]
MYDYASCKIDHALGKINQLKHMQLLLSLLSCMIMSSPFQERYTMFGSCYFGLLSIRGTIFIPGPVTLTVGRCIATYLISAWSFPIFLFTADLVMILQVYAMWNQSKWILWVLLFIYYLPLNVALLTLAFIPTLKQSVGIVCIRTNHLYVFPLYFQYFHSSQHNREWVAFSELALPYNYVHICSIIPRYIIKVVTGQDQGQEKGMEEIQLEELGDGTHQVIEGGDVHNTKASRLEKLEKGGALAMIVVTWVEGPIVEETQHPMAENGDESIVSLYRSQSSVHSQSKLAVAWNIDRMAYHESCFLSYSWDNLNVLMWIGRISLFVGSSDSALEQYPLTSSWFSE